MLQEPELKKCPKCGTNTWRFLACVDVGAPRYDDVVIAQCLRCATRMSFVSDPRIVDRRQVN